MWGRPRARARSAFARRGARALGVLAALLAAVALGALALDVGGAAGEAAAVEIFDLEHGRPCPPIPPEDAPAPVGATARSEDMTCEMTAFAQDIDVWTLSALGDIRVSGSCGITFELVVDGRGNAVLRGFRSSGPSPCPDLGTCSGPRGGWPGSIRLVGERRYALELDACLDTCMGRFEGPLTMSLEPTWQGWLLRARDALVGTSGWRYASGSWMLDDASELRLSAADEGGQK